MAKCRRCGKSGLFLRLVNGMCSDCKRAVWREVEEAQTSLAEQPLANAVNERGAETTLYSQYAERMGKALEQELSSDELGANILQEIMDHGIDADISAELNHVISLMAYRALISGERPESLAKELLTSFSDLDYDMVYRAIHTKCGVASNARIKFRAVKGRMNWYIWRTARDQRVRSEHEILNGVICNWNDPPQPHFLLNGSTGECVHPGYATECRCIALPVISVNDISLPTRVYISGEIIEISDRNKLLATVV